MAKGPTSRESAEQTEEATHAGTRQAEQAMRMGTQQAEQAMRMGSEGMDWMRVFAEQSLNLSKAAVEGYLAAARKTANSMNQQASEFRERSISLAHESLTHTFEFANRVMRAKEPQELLHLQSEFLTRQVQTLAERTNDIGQVMAQGVKAASKTATEQMRTAAE